MFTTIFKTRSDLTLAADVSGDQDQPVVLLLHGARENRHAWGRTARALDSAGRYVVSLDLRGHGDSDFAPDGDYRLERYVEDVADVIRQLPSRPVVAGFLLGGLIALALQEADPDVRPKAVFLVDTTLTVSERRLPSAALRQSEETFESLSDAILGVKQSPPFRNRARTPGQMGRLVELVDGHWRWRYDLAAVHGAPELRATLLRDRPRLERAAAAMSVPCLLAYTESVGRDDAEAMAAVIPTARVARIVENSGPAIEQAIDARLVDFLEEVDQRDGGGPIIAGVDPKILRRTLGNFATGIAVVTVRDNQGAPVGLTVNSFTSVSLDPPLVLFCIDNKSSLLSHFCNGAAFAVNVLHLGQQEISNRFATRAADRFAEIAWEEWDTGAPILNDVMANIECRQQSIVPAGDHHIIIGEVNRVWFAPSRDPLLYFQGEYRQVHISID